MRLEVKLRSQTRDTLSRYEGDLNMFLRDFENMVMQAVVGPTVPRGVGTN